MLRQLSSLFALMMSSGLISVGHGALGALVVQQGSHYGFSDTFLGALITVSYAGFVAGNYLFRWMLPRISYIRTFSVCAAVLTAGTLMLPLLKVELAWLVLRFGHGLFFSITVIICESWLNSTVDNQHRGKVHATHMTINYLAYGLSQYVLLLGSENAATAFSLVAMFVVLSLFPICMTRFAEPQASISTNKESTMTIRAAYEIAPVSYVAQFGNGMFTGASWLFVRYAEQTSASEAAASTLAVVFFGAGFLLQLPVGWISDRAKDRRSVMSFVYGCSALLAFFLFFGDLFSSGILILFVLLYGMISATGFSLNIAYGQDLAGRERASEYAGMLFQPYAVGAIIGPMIAGFLMDRLSVSWLFLFIGIITISITVYTIFHRMRYALVEPDTQNVYPVVSSTGLTPTISEEAPLYSNYDIGPDIPESTTLDEEIEHELVGPQLGEMLVTDIDLIGPTLPADDDDLIHDDNLQNWRR